MNKVHEDVRVKEALVAAPSATSQAEQQSRVQAVEPPTTVSLSWGAAMLGLAIWSGWPDPRYRLAIEKDVLLALIGANAAQDVSGRVTRYLALRNR